MPNHWSHSRGPRTGVAWPYDRILVFNGCHRLQPPLSTTSQIAQILLSLSLTVLRLRLANCIGFWVSFTCGPQARRAWRRYRHHMHLLPSSSLCSLSLLSLLSLSLSLSPAVGAPVPTFPSVAGLRREDGGSMTIVFCTMARHIAPSSHTTVPTLGDLSSHDLAWR